MKKLKNLKKCPFLIITLVITIGLFIYGLLLIFDLVPSSQAAMESSGESSIEVAVAVRELKSGADRLLGETDDFDYTKNSAPAEYVPDDRLKEKMDSAKKTEGDKDREEEKKDDNENSQDNSDKEDKDKDKDKDKDNKDVKNNENEPSEAEPEPEEAKDSKSSPYVSNAGEIRGPYDPVSETDASFTGPNDGFYAVDEGYFSQGDTLFIGDSRVQGFGLYSKIPGLVMYADKGYAIHQVFTKAFIPMAEGKVTLEEAMALEPNRFNKIYIKFGLNEMGWGNAEMFGNAYYRLIDMLKYYQPNAVIYVQSVIAVTRNKSNGSSVFNNANVYARNEALKTVAENEHICYLDLNSVFMNEEGCLPSEYTSDGIHIKAPYMQIWVDFLKTHALISSYSDWDHVTGYGATGENPYVSESPDHADNIGPETNDTGNNEPAENPPAENPPAENPPVENPPAENPPAENPPADTGNPQEGTPNENGGDNGNADNGNAGNREHEEIIETDWETGGGID